LLTVREAAALPRVSERTLRRLIASGTIACVRIGRAIRIRRRDLIV
jgi:excisionase family DNA binding protein